MKNSQTILLLIFAFVLNGNAQNISNNYFTLSKSLSVDIEVDGGPGGKLVFDKDSFMLYLEIANINAQKQPLKLNYSVYRLIDTISVYDNIYSLQIKKNGRVTNELQNKSKYNKFIMERNRLLGLIEVAKDSILLLDEEKNSDLLKRLYLQVETNYKLLYELKEVVPKRKMTDPYKDIVGEFINNGLLTEKGIVWAKSLPFLKGKLSKFTKKENPDKKKR